MVMEIDLFHLVNLPPMDEQLAILPTLGHKVCLDSPETGSSLQRITENLLPENTKVSMPGNKYLYLL